MCTLDLGFGMDEGVFKRLRVFFKYLRGSGIVEGFFQIVLRFSPIE